MPPKNKGKKSSKSRTPNLINGLTKDELSKEQMEEHIVQLREELDREREERNYFQLERDKIFSFWEISKRELEEVRAGLTNVHKDIEEDEERHQVEIKVYKEKMKHLLYEHENTMSELKAGGLVTTEAMQKEQDKLEAKLHMEKEARIVDLQEVDNEKLAMELEQQKHNDEVTKTRKSWEMQLAEIKAEYDKKLSLLPQEVDNLRKNQMSEREDHWNSHIAALKEDHHQAVAESSVLIEYIQHDADVNVSLKIQIKDMKKKQKQKEKELIPILQDNRRLAEQLLKLEEEITENEKKMKNFTIKKNSDNIIEKAKIKERNHLKSDYEALEQKFTQLQLERDELYNTFDQRVQKVQQKGDEKIQRLEDQMKALTDSLEKTQAQISSVLSVSNMDPTAFYRLAENIEEDLNTSNSTIKQLQFQISQISKARMDLLLTYEAKQRLLGVPVEEPCVKPVENSLTGNPEMRNAVSHEINV